MSNPYQIRYDVLNMAKEIADKHYDMQVDLANKMLGMYKEDTEQALDAWQKYVPKALNPDEIKTQAEKLYEFVSERK